MSRECTTYADKSAQSPKRGEIADESGNYTTALKLDQEHIDKMRKAAESFSDWQTITAPPYTSTLTPAYMDSGTHSFAIFVEALPHALNELLRALRDTKAIEASEAEDVPNRYAKRRAYCAIKLFHMDGDLLDMDDFELVFNSYPNIENETYRDYIDYWLLSNQDNRVDGKWQAPKKFFPRLVETRPRSYNQESWSKGPHTFAEFSEICADSFEWEEVTERDELGPTKASDEVAKEIVDLENDTLYTFSIVAHRSYNADKDKDLKNTRQLLASIEVGEVEIAYKADESAAAPSDVFSIKITAESANLTGEWWITNNVARAVLADQGRFKHCNKVPLHVAHYEWVAAAKVVSDWREFQKDIKAFGIRRSKD